MYIHARMALIAATILLCSCSTLQDEQAPNYPRSDSQPILSTPPRHHTDNREKRAEEVAFRRLPQISLEALAQVNAQFDTLNIEEYKLKEHLLHSIEFSNGILFEFDKSELTVIDVMEIRRFAELYAEHSVGKYLYVVGHTDSRGTRSYNQSLSARRALVVASLLVRAGVPTDLIKLVPAGEVIPIAVNNNKNGRAKNRRVEIVAADSKELVKAFLRNRNCGDVDEACSPALVPVIPVTHKGEEIVLSLNGKELVATNTPQLNDLRSLALSLSKDKTATDNIFSRQSETERLALLEKQIRTLLQLKMNVRPEMSLHPEIRKSMILPQMYHAEEK